MPICTIVGDLHTQLRMVSPSPPRAREHRRYEIGQQPFWTPLRFPGQYYDAESDLFENWNIDTKPNIGLYLQPEPLLSMISTLTNDCQSSSADECPPLAQNPSPPDARRRDEDMLRRMLECEKGAQCEYEACLAGAQSAAGTTDWIQAWTACQARP